MPADAALGDRTNLVYQNSRSLSPGEPPALVTGTGTATEMGKIAGMLGRVERSPSPLETELRQLTLRLAAVCLVAVAFILAVGFARGLPADAVMASLAIATAISSIPSGLPTFLTAMLSYGAQRLAAAQAIVRNLSDVEALGAVSAINADKTGTLTLDKMTAPDHAGGQWFTVSGTGYATSGEILHAAGRSLPDLTALGYGLTLCSDATVGPDQQVVGDPTEAALVVLAAKMGVDAADVAARVPAGGHWCRSTPRTSSWPPTTWSRWSTVSRTCWCAW